MTASFGDGAPRAAPLRDREATRTGQQISVAGMHREFNNYTLDGIANADVS